MATATGLKGGIRYTHRQGHTKTGDCLRRGADGEVLVGKHLETERKGGKAKGENTNSVCGWCVGSCCCRRLDAA